ncbi:hypothetical protein H9X57_05680 [Flavobacterium piscinae]|uniref:DUF4382 domain-containing protein n=1 Tax=Flavobacterium piscinae TaxID=2506424 RepID=A0A4Q1KI10_9FLAO|nr:hypothetical protein [Flavobacterium piscinae]MBC8883061.1 hypothetical protein [Flavobacterium piscinae]RXR29418.1 hypothetical protein EQG68_13105 [Flavobacterium piscinae]
MKNKKILLGLLTIIFSTVSCSNDESSSNDSNDNLTILAKASYSGNTGRMENAVSISDFKINLKEIEFELDDDFYDDDDDDYGDGFYGDDDEFELRGPFELDLLSGQTTITTINIPNGVYEEVEFKMARNNNAESELFNKSVLIKGTIGSTPFVFWHNIDEDFEIDYEDAGQNLVIADNAATLVIDFNLDAVLANVDLSNATDDNGDGLIEISPNDTDGNQSLANTIKDKIEEYTDLLDD